MPQPARMSPGAATAFYDLQHFVLAERGSEGGCICPVCGARNKVKKYRLMPLHFRMLARLMAAGVGVNLHWRQFVDADSATKILQIPKHYTLIGQNTEDAENPFNRSGRWHITELGADFLSNRCQVPFYFWGIHDVPIWWAMTMGTADDIRMRVLRDHPADIIEEMMRARLHGDLNVTGQFPVEYL